jgi:hypothetical protein
MEIGKMPAREINGGKKQKLPKVLQAHLQLLHGPHAGDILRGNATLSFLLADTHKACFLVGELIEEALSCPAACSGVEHGFSCFLFSASAELGRRQETPPPPAMGKREKRERK